MRKKSKKTVEQADIKELGIEELDVAGLGIDFTELTEDDYGFTGWGEYAKPIEIELQTESVFGLLDKKREVKPDTAKHLTELETKVEEAKEKVRESKVTECESNRVKSVIPSKVKSKNKFIQLSNSARDKALIEANKSQGRDAKYPYKAIDILTRAEKQLYFFIKDTIDAPIEIFAKPRLADIIKVDENITTEIAFARQIWCKHVDFVICDKRTLDIICAVELDDYTHDTDERQSRDNFVDNALKSAGIPIIRIKTRVFALTAEDLTEIEYHINLYQAPICPHCKLKMEPRKRRNGDRIWGCPNYFKTGCNYTEKID